MNKQQTWISGVLLFALIAFISISKAGAQNSTQTGAPFLGWNSYNCYGSHINEKLTNENLDAFIRVNYPVTKNKLSSGRGYERMDHFSYAQKKTFITQRAMAASPLFMGGTLISSPKIVFELITNEDMLACNQNGVTGELIKRISTYAEMVDIWKTPHKTKEKEGWIGVFNRNAYMELIKFDKEELGLNKGDSYQLYDIWGQRIIEDAETFIFEIPADDVIFIRYKKI